MVTKMFKEQLGKNMEAYIDDMVVKSKATEDHLIDLAETFETLRKHHLKLNASKCAFGVSLGKFLGNLVTHRGIKVNPNQILALQSLKSPKNAKEDQGLTRMIAALNRFISQSTDRCRPFFQLLKKWKAFSGWMSASKHSMS